MLYGAHLDVARGRVVRDCVQVMFGAQHAARCSCEPARCLHPCCALERPRALPTRVARECMCVYFAAGKLPTLRTLCASAVSECLCLQLLYNAHRLSLGREHFLVVPPCSGLRMVSSRELTSTPRCGRIPGEAPPSIHALSGRPDVSDERWTCRSSYGVPKTSQVVRRAPVGAWCNVHHLQLGGKRVRHGRGMLGLTTFAL